MHSERKIAGINKINSREIHTAKKFGSKRDGVYVALWKREKPGKPRIGIIAGRGFKSAVKRNLARRRVAGCVIELKSLLRDGVDYLFECKPGCEAAPYQELARDVRNCLLR